MQRVEANYDMEQTGQNGCLPDMQKTIFCADQLGPDYKPNYYVKSCQERLMNGSCKRGNCEHFHSVPDEVNRSLKKVGEYGDCSVCGEFGKFYTKRELCYKCHRPNRRK